MGIGSRYHGIARYRNPEGLFDLLSLDGVGVVILEDIDDTVTDELAGGVAWERKDIGQFGGITVGLVGSAYDDTLIDSAFYHAPRDKRKIFSS